jgi:hypothetical protein
MKNLMVKDCPELFSLLRENGYDPYFSGWSALNGNIKIDKKEVEEDE